jgi:hypothetical protein
MQNLQSSLTGQFGNNRRVDDDNQVDIDNKRGKDIFLIEFAIRSCLRLRLQSRSKGPYGEFSALPWKPPSAPLGNSEY